MRLPGRKIELALLLSVLALAGTAPNAGAAKAKPPTVKWLLGKEFKSVSATGSPLIKGQTVEMRFFMHSNYPGSKPKRPTISVYAGCNYWGTKFRIRKKRLFTYGMTDSTAMGCEVDPDGWLSRVMRKGLAIQRKGQRLVLSHPAKRVKLVFRQVAKERAVPDRKVPDKPNLEKPIDFAGDPATYETLDGKTYESTKVIGRQLKEPIELTFRTGKLNRLDDDGKQAEGPVLAAYLGCNWMGGEYELDDGRLAWFDVMQTDKGCFGDGHANDSWLHDLLKKGVEAVTRDDLLALTSGDTQIILRQVP